VLDALAGFARAAAPMRVGGKSARRRRFHQRFQGHERRRDDRRAQRACPWPLVLIAGGLGKGADFAPLADAARGKVKAAVLIGASAGELERALAPVCPTRRADDMRRRAAAAGLELAPAATRCCCRRRARARTCSRLPPSRRGVRAAVRELPMNCGRAP
jgi:hypothetical protein